MCTATLLLAGLSGCGPEQSDLGQLNSASVSLNVTMPEQVAAASNPRNSFWATFQRWLFPTEAWAAGGRADLAILRVEVSAADLLTPVSGEVTVPSTGNVVTIPLDVPVGANRVFTASGLDRTRARIFLKDSDPVTLNAGQTITVDIDLAAGKVGFVGSLTDARDSHTATLLLNGQVLVVGGNAGVASSELYNSAINKWTPATGLTDARRRHTATLLQNGKVLVAGGDECNDGCPSALAELFDPSTQQWTKVSNLTDARIGHTATLLQNGKVLVVGGFGDNDWLASAELFDPATSQWTKLATGLTQARSDHTATLLPNGQVLVAGGSGIQFVRLTSAELFNPATSQWTSLATGLTDTRVGHTATLLQNGKVLVVGGFGDNGLLASAELFDPATSQWTKLATGLTQARSNHTATLLRNGEAFIIGGLTSFNQEGETDTRLSSAELFDPATSQWTKLATGLTEARGSHTATLLLNGQVLVGGGNDSNFEGLASAELLDLTFR